MIKCEVQIFDVSALLWSLTWPAETSELRAFVNTFLAFALGALSNGNTIFVFDRYFENSTKSYQRILCQESDGSSRPYTLKLDMLSPPRSSILKVAANKEQLNQMLSDALMKPESYQHRIYIG